VKYPRHATYFRGHFDAVPVVGTLFLLVLFLLLNSFIVFPPGVRIDLPPAPDLPGAAYPTLTVAADARNQLYFENQVISEGQLHSRLAQAVGQSKEPLALTVQLDKSVSMDTLVRLTSIARAAGIRQVLLATEPALIRDAPGSAGAP
jgi:biopolymer transport protein ExbD